MKIEKSIFGVSVILLIILQILNYFHISRNKSITRELIQTSGTIIRYMLILDSSFDAWEEKIDPENKNLSSEDYKSEKYIKIVKVMNEILNVLDEKNSLTIADITNKELYSWRKIITENCQAYLKEADVRIKQYDFLTNGKRYIDYFLIILIVLVVILIIVKAQKIV